MDSRSRFLPFQAALRSAPLALGLAALLSPALALAGDEPADGRKDASVRAAAPTRTVVVGKATLNWHLTPDKTTQRSDLFEAFRKATEAHLTGGEPVVTPKAGPITLPGGQPMFRTPAEMIHTMFVGPDGRNYCSDSTVPAKAATVRNADGEGR